MSRKWLTFPPNGLPIVQVNLHTQRFFALVDTGAQISIISPKVAASFGFAMRGQILLVGITGATELVPTTTLSDLRLAGIAWDPLVAAIADVARLNKKIDLVLGVTAFRNQKLQIHFQEGRIYLLD